MSDTTNITWCDATFNPWIGCTKVSAGCTNCYAAKDTFARVKRGQGVELWGKGKPRHRTSSANWKLPLKWNYQGHLNYEQGDGYRPRVFCASLADWLDDEVPIGWLADLMRLIYETPYLDWLLLTKRPENFASRIHKAYMETACGSMGADQMMFAWDVNGDAPHNVWIGTTVEDQQRADERIPHLLKIPTKVRFLSCEPLLEAVQLRLKCDDPDGEGSIYRNALAPGYGFKDIHWVITGGESGPCHRPFNPDWARSLRDQCKAAGVAFHMKQMGGLRPSSMPPIPDDLLIREWPKGGDQ